MCVGYYTAGHTHEHAHTFWQTSALSHTSLMFRHKYLRMLPGSQIVSWKPDLIYTSFWCILILHYIEVVKKGNKWRRCFNFAWEYSLQPTLWHIYIECQNSLGSGSRAKKSHVAYWSFALILGLFLKFDSNQKYLSLLKISCRETSLHNWLWQ